MLKTLKPLSSVVEDVSNRLPEGLDDCRMSVMRKLFGMKIEYIDHPDIHQDDAQNVLFAKIISPDKAAADWDVIFQDNDDNERTSKSATEYILNKDDEKLLFLQYNYARFRVYENLKHAHQRRLSEPEVVEVVEWQGVAEEIRNTLFIFNLPLVYAIGRRTGHINWAHSTELIEHGEDGLINAIEKFNVGLGWKFSTYAFRAITRRFTRYAEKLIKQYKMERSVGEFKDWSSWHPEHSEEESIENRSELEKMYKAIINPYVLTERERNILLRRFFRYHKLKEIGDTENMSKERIRQIIDQALTKLWSEMVA